MATTVATQIEVGWPMTYASLKEMPQDGNRYEIIDREPFLSSAPSLLHAEVVARRFVLSRVFVLQHQLGGRVFTAPGHVRFTHLRVVEPDVVYVGPTKSLLMADPALIDGAPDLVVEVVSPSSRRYDQDLKFRVYAEGGVLEYWLADPQRRMLTIFAREESGFVALPVAGGVVRPRLLPGLEVDVASLFADLLP